MQGGAARPSMNREDMIAELKRSQDRIQELLVRL
jgi:hypothetical protein